MTRKDLDTLYSTIVFTESKGGAFCGMIWSVVNGQLDYDYLGMFRKYQAEETKQTKCK